MIYTTELTVKKFIIAICFFIVEGSNAYADNSKNEVAVKKINDSADHWNKVDQLILDCDTAQSFGTEEQVRDAALKLWAVQDMPYDLRASAESCVSDYLSDDVIFTWSSGWELLINETNLKLLSKPVVDLLERYEAFCTQEEKGRLQIPSTAIEKIDLTGNGKLDTVFHVGRVRCNGTSSYFSGSGGSATYLIVNDKVTKFQARGFAVSYALGEGYPIIILAMHGSSCDSYGATNCVLATVWGNDRFEVVRSNRE